MRPRRSMWLLAGLLGGLLVAGCTAEMVAPATNNYSSGDTSDSGGNTNGGGTNGGGDASDTAPVVVVSATPSIVDAGGSSTLGWSTERASSCAASGAWSGSRATSGTANLSGLTTSDSYTLTCTGPGGSASGSATIAVRTASASRTAALSANPLHVRSGGTTALAWSSADMESCTASNTTGNTGWSGAKALAGNQTVTLNASTTFLLNCTGPNGNSERAVRVIVARPPAGNAPASVPTPADLIFYDNFEYVVNRGNGTANGTGALTDCSAFRTRGWSWAKAINCTGSANGFLYTVEPNAIPGHSGAFPGVASNRVLAMEARPAYGFQTSFHLQYGDGEAAGFDDYIPGNVWIQFWMYIAYAGDQLSQFDAGNKFLYPCNQAYPCHNHKWLTGINVNNSIPFGSDIAIPSQGAVFIATRVNNTYMDEVNGQPISTVVNEGVGEWDYGKLGHTNNADFFPIAPNRWTLVKMHMDTAATSGVYEVWMRTVNGPWVKTMDWIDGVTPGFVWQVNRNHVGGHKVLSMPTTIGSGIVERPRWDAWIYLDDFAMAHTEAGLPRY